MHVIYYNKIIKNVLILKFKMAASDYLSFFDLGNQGG